MSAKVAVVIPYYQRRPGILQKALSSVIGQNCSEGYHTEIVVVDDSSPAPAEAEVQQIPRPQRDSIRIIRQPNKGPAGARNTGLDHLDESTEFVAFLDSDDEWVPEHLDNAIRALGKDHDFYFSDFYQLEQEVSAFARARRITPANHPTIPGHESLHYYNGNMVEQIITGNVIGTSTVVYRFTRNRTLRFREEFVNAGEDYLFWLDLTSRNDRIVFSSLCECRYGHGVNVFSGAKWGTEELLKRIRYEIQYRKTITREFAVTREQANHLARRIRQSRAEFAGEVLHRVRYRKSLSLQQLFKFCQV